MNYRKFFFIIFGLIVALTFNVVGQTRIASPYSRYGLGDLQNVNYLGNISMGGISYGYRNPSSVNYANPASYTAFDTNSFVFETGLNSQTVQLKTTNLSEVTNYTSLSYLTFGFPVTKWWGASMGLLPYSSVGYKISDYTSMPEVGKVKYLYEGDGGLNQFYFGNGFKLFKNLSVGFNASYLFGYLNQTRTITFPDSINFLSTRLINSTRINDFLFNFGTQYHKTWKSGYSIVIGLEYSASTSLTAKQDSFAYSFTTDGVNESVKDTIVNSSNVKGKIVMPQSFGGGITFGKSDRWLLGIDYQMQDWSKFSSFGVKDSLKNSWTTAFGAEYTPKSTAVSGYWKRVHYRMGARYSKSYLELRNTQLSDYAVSLGFGLPLKRSKTAVNIGFEYGERGTTLNSLIKEQYGRVILSVSAYEPWFYKHKFD